MALAAIDIGSNSIRILVAEVKGELILPLRFERVITRLAGGMDSTGRLDRKAMERTLAALRRYLLIAREKGATHIRAVGTSALREAENSGEFMEKILAGVGIGVEVVSGRREAELTARGVLSGMEVPSSSLIIDIGGGSTEWTFCNGHEINESDTLPVGVVKLTDRHLRSDPPAVSEIAHLEAELEGISEALRKVVEGSIGDETVLVATAGTASTLASIDLGLEAFDPRKIHMHGIALSRLGEISRLLLSLPLRERASLKGLEPERADLIIPGILFTIKIMESLGFKRTLISSCGLLEGVILELTREVTA